MVANVREENIKDSSRIAWYRLFDGTNDKPITALRSYHDASTLEKVIPPQDGTIPRLRYVRVVGYLNPSGNSGMPMIKCTGFQLVKDPHEPYAHILSVLFTELCIQKGPPVSVVSMVFICDVDILH